MIGVVKQKKKTTEEMVEIKFDREVVNTEPVKP